VRLAGMIPHRMMVSASIAPCDEALSFLLAPERGRASVCSRTSREDQRLQIFARACRQFQLLLIRVVGMSDRSAQIAATGFFQNTSKTSISKKNLEKRAGQALL